MPVRPWAVTSRLVENRITACAGLLGTGSPPSRSSRADGSTRRCVRIMTAYITGTSTRTSMMSLRHSAATAGSQSRRCPRDTPVGSSPVRRFLVGRDLRPCQRVPPGRVQSDGDRHRAARRGAHRSSSMSMSETARWDVLATAAAVRLVTSEAACRPRHPAAATRCVPTTLPYPRDAEPARRRGPTDTGKCSLR